MDLIGFGGFRSPEDDPPKPWRRWVRFLGTTGLPVGLHLLPFKSVLGSESSLIDYRGSGCPRVGHRHLLSRSHSASIPTRGSSAPLIYGDFDNDLLRINGRGHFSGLGSSREYKDNIRDLTMGEAMEALKGLNPVKFTYKVDRGRGIQDSSLRKPLSS